MEENINEFDLPKKKTNESHCKAFSQQKLPPPLLPQIQLSHFLPLCPFTNSNKSMPTLNFTSSTTAISTLRFFHTLLFLPPHMSSMS